MNPFDPANAPKSVPSEIMQGTFCHWSIADLIGTDYDHAVARYQYTAKRADDASNTQKVVDVAANGYVSFTMNWQIGVYYWQLYTVRQSDNARVLVSNGTFKVLPDSSSAVDMRPHAVVMLAKIESLLEGRADSDVASYTIQSRQINKMNVSELTKWREHYKNEVAKLTADEALRTGTHVNRNKVRARFI